MKNQPSKKALKQMISFLLTTSVPRILAEKEKSEVKLNA